MKMCRAQPSRAPHPLPTPCYDSAVDPLQRKDDGHLPDEFESESETLVAVLSGAVRKGEWEPRERIRVFALMGGAELDFREAVMLEGVTEVSIFAMMGGVNILVPPDIDVQSEGFGLMGGFTHLGHRAEEADAPLLRIKGLAVMGGVDVKVKKEKKKWFGKK
jgi:hypothetical protein